MEEIATPRRLPGPARSKEERKLASKSAILERDNHQCVYCGCSLRFTQTPCEQEPGTFLVHGNIPTIDHVVPSSRGGSNKASNLVAACVSCNSQKGNMTGEEYRAWKARAK
jgi:5-methylcytosine-specific restriction endonuclease McrA